MDRWVQFLLVEGFRLRFDERGMAGRYVRMAMDRTGSRTNEDRWDASTRTDEHWNSMRRRPVWLTRRCVVRAPRETLEFPPA